MWTLLNSPETYVFSVALVLMCLIGLLEAVSLLTSGFSQTLDSLLPDVLLESTPPELKLSLDDMGAFVRFLDWLYVGRVPLMMLFVIALAVFGATGWVLQLMWFNMSGSLIYGWLAFVLASVLSLPLIRASAAGWYKIMPKDESTAVAEDALIGRVGVVVTGTATATQSAEVRVKDHLGQIHYVMMLADGGADLPQGTTVLIVSRQGHLYHAIENVNANLVD